MENHSQNRPLPEGCSCPSGCGAGLERRQFLKTVALGTVASLLSGPPVVAGPFEAADFEKLVPADKKLDPAWVRSLFARGPDGLPGGRVGEDRHAGGRHFAGQLYLGGDGKLWHWDIFNQQIDTHGENYAAPPKPESPLEQGFALRISSAGKNQFRSLDHTGFADITFCGQYPIARVEYRDDDAPVAVSLEAFSPFIPLDCADSSLPATVMQFTVKNTSPQHIAAEVSGRLQNPVHLFSRTANSRQRRNHIARTPKILMLDCGDVPQPPARENRPDIVFETFQKETYDGWEVTGTAFGNGPIPKSQIPGYMGDVGSPRDRLVNSHASAPGEDVTAKDSQVGTLTSKPFLIERELHQLLDRRRQPSRPNVHQSARRRQGGGHGHRRQRQPHGARDV